MKLKDDPELTLYTINDLASLFKVTPRTIYNYVYTEQLNGYKIANKWRFSKANIEEFLEKKRELSPAKYVRGTKKHFEHK